MTAPEKPEPETPDDDPRATLALHDAGDFAAAALRLCDGAREQVRILPQRADLRYLAGEAIVTALRTWLLGSRRARLQMLLPPDLGRDDLGRPLWGLARRLTTSVAVHRLSDADAQLGEAWLTVDRHGYLHRLQADRLAGHASLLQPPRARELDQRFDALWLASEPDPDVRRLSL